MRKTRWQLLLLKNDGADDDVVDEDIGRGRWHTKYTIRNGNEKGEKKKKKNERNEKDENRTHTARE